MDKLLVLLDQGGFTMYILAICSVLTVALLLERVYVYYLASQMLNSAQNGGQVAPWFTRMVQLEYASPAAADLHEANALRLSRFLNARLGLLATIGGTAPFIGLFGTVIGIMHSFHQISVAKGTGLEVVGGGISEALICTASGLAVAIFAVVGYNLLRTWGTRIEEALDLAYLTRSNHDAPGGDAN